MTIDRRTLVKGAAWTAPAVALAVAAPAEATSQPTVAIIRFTNVTATPAGPNQIAFNTKIQRSDQPNGGANVRVNGTFKLLLNGKLVFSRVFQLNNYESTPIFQETFSGLTKGEYVVTFQAFYETGSISDSVNVAEQSWWA